MLKFLNSLKDNRSDLYEMLSEYQNILKTEANPRDKMRLKQEINQVKLQIKEKDEEIAQVEKELPASNKENNSTHYLRVEYQQLTDIIDVDFDAKKELKEVNKQISELEVDKQNFVFLTADPKNTNPIKALEQKQIIEDIVKDKFLFKDNTKTFYNKIGEKTKDSSYIHITTHGKNDKLIFAHNVRDNQEAPVTADYLCFQLKKNKDKKKLVVLMACQSVNIAIQLVSESLTEFAIGTNSDISATAAVEFTKQFYTELLADSDIESAFENCCFELNNNPYRAMRDDGSKYNYSKEFQLIS